MEEVVVDTEVLNSDEGQDSNTDTTGDDDTAARLEKAEEIARNQRIRAEKAETALKALKKAPAEGKEKQTTDLSSREIIALRDVPEDDIDEVIDFARYKGITIAEAKKNTVMQTILRSRAEERATAQAANTSATRRGSKTNSSDVLISKVYKNEDMSADEMGSAAKSLVDSLKRKK